MLENLQNYHLTEWQQRYRNLEHVSSQRYRNLEHLSSQKISELEHQCESYQKEIENVDIVCHMLRNDNQTLRRKLQETENLLVESQSSTVRDKLLSENAISELKSNITSLKVDMERLKNNFNAKSLKKSSTMLSSTIFKEVNSESMITETDWDNRNSSPPSDVNFSQKDNRNKKSKRVYSPSNILVRIIIITFYHCIKNDA